MEVVGSSYCTQEEATIFVKGWKGDYNLFTKNCQHFARALQIYLTNGLFNQPPSNHVRHEDNTVDLNQLINDILKKLFYSVL